MSVCTRANVVGAYQARYRLPLDEDLASGDLSQLGSLSALNDWMIARNALNEDGRAAPGSRLPARIAPPSLEDVWLRHAVVATERAITMLVDEFVADPYLHRVEHSMHARLFELLKNQPELGTSARLRSGEVTQLVHKEWPETVDRSVDGHRRPRGLFDLAILAPSQLQRASLDQFRTGRIDAAIVIEVGLDYALAHLEQDARKLANSSVVAPYLVHLSRIAAAAGPVETLVSNPTPPCRTAYVHHDPRSASVRWKHVNGTVIQSFEPAG